MEESCVNKSVRWLQGLAEGATGSSEFEVLTLAGLEIVEARERFIRCNFIVPLRLADENGNWQVGAMATVIDDVGAAAIYTLGGNIKLSVDFNISFYSTAKIQENIEIEAKAVGDTGKLTSVQVEVRRKDNGEVIALAKQWMASSNLTASPGMSKSKL
ncbi:hypothetical protein LWI28_008743 [Acer negundo]|uniref:Acyl-coenzyme A thioesterase 13 n=1 Tax=Acer negundo TaxID=4023 RepID=A0AAD5IZ80_ACENE|nr:hypothetical protein LWI28_008743 [Acer negundo]KAK4842262.1 hypothetical protein QYF36_018754 [Acer negundo]